jgi:hydrogenase maturation protease
VTRQVLVACVGNVLRGDDGFGVAVAERLAAGGDLPPGVDLIETGIGGLSIVQRLMDGYDALVVVDVVDQGAPPGSVFVLEPGVPDPHGMPTAQWRELFSNLHLAEPSRVLLLARAAGVLPPRVVVVGCQPQRCDEYEQRLSGPVAVAVAEAAFKVRELVVGMTASPARG